MQNLPTQTTLSIKAKEPDSRLLALKESRLKILLKDKAVFAKMCEAAVMLLNNEKIRACDEASIFGALYKAVTLGCRLEQEFGECHLIPRTLNVGTRENPQWLSVCCFQLGYKYWKAKALESGHIRYMETREVYAEDSFAFKYGSGAYWEHIPAQENKGVTVWFYAAAPLKEGGEIFQAINKQTAEKYRRNSESQWDVKGTGQNRVRTFKEKPSDIWLQNYPAMALRLPVKQLCAMLPLTPAIEKAMSEDGSVTYIQADGKISRLEPGEVEEAAEKIEAKALPPISEEKKAEFEQWEDALSACSKFEEVFNHYEQFKGSEAYKELEFVRLFWTNVARVSETDEQLGKVFHSSKEWVKTTELVKILTDKKEALETAKKAAK